MKFNWLLLCGGAMTLFHIVMFIIGALTHFRRRKKE
jgi:hypothetical protein